MKVVENMRFSIRCCKIHTKKYALMLLFVFISVVILIVTIIFRRNKSTIYFSSYISPTKQSGVDNHIPAEVHEVTNIASFLMEHKKMLQNANEKYDQKRTLVFPSEADLRLQAMKEKAERLSGHMKNNNIYETLDITSPLEPNYNVHVFYYPWYANIEEDGSWQHWNHEYIENWRNEDNNKYYPSGRHEPPEDLGSSYYPMLGTYSSHSSHVIDIHMKQIHDVGIGVVVVSWYPPNSKESTGDVFHTILDIAVKYKLRVAPHIEPYNNRNPTNLRAQLSYLSDKYSSHPGIHRIEKNGYVLPVYYIYDSYLTEAADWRELLNPKGNMSVRGTKYDGFFIGLLVDMQHRYAIRKACFDGFYTYFGSNGFTYGSSWKNWRSLSRFSRQSGLLFVPSVAPGYIDTAVRPWNTASTRNRQHGSYYQVAWRSAVAAPAQTIAITSYNEWHEGTQIEPAVPKQTSSFKYLDYEPEGPFFYLNLTRLWVNKFTKKLKS